MKTDRLQQNRRTMSNPPPSKRQQEEDKTQESNTMMSTSFALEFWSKKIIDVDIILSITLTVLKKVA